MTNVADRLEINDVLAKFARAADRCDEELFRSIYHPDATVDHAGMFNGKAGDFVAAVIPLLRSIGPTSHYFLNTLAEIAGDKAKIEAYAIHRHRLEKDGEKFDSVFGVRHLHELSKDGGSWRILRHRAVFDWNRDEAVSETWSRGLFGAAFQHGSKDRSDPSYR